MNKRLKKKFEKNRRRDIHRILDMALDINGLGCRKRDVTGFLPTAFMEFSGHTAAIEVQIFKNGWSAYQRPEKRFCTYIDKPGSLKQMIKKMEQCQKPQRVEPPGNPM